MKIDLENDFGAHWLCRLVVCENGAEQKVIGGNPVTRKKLIQFQNNHEPARGKVLAIFLFEC